MARGLLSALLLFIACLALSANATSNLRSLQATEEVIVEQDYIPAGKDGVQCGAKTCKECEVCRAEGNREPWCFRPDSIECARAYVNSQPRAVCSGVTCQACEVCQAQNGRDVCFRNPSMCP